MEFETQNAVPDIPKAGRAIVGNAGILLMRVEYLKHGEEKNFAVVDAAEPIERVQAEVIGQVRDRLLPALGARAG